VDLKSLYEWTRGQLEAEAEKRGIKGYRSLSRVELIRELMTQGLTVSQQTVRLAQSALSSALSSAVIRLPRQLEALKSWSRRLPAASRVWGEPVEPHAMPTSGSLETAKRLRVEVTASIQEVDEAPPIELIPSVRTFSEEPIRTRSMARLLAAQGHRDRACAIYEELLKKVPTDAQLRSEAEAVRGGQHPGRDTAERLRRACNAEPIILPERPDTVQCERGVRGELSVSWTITEEGVARAAAVLGRQGELAVRIMAVIPDPELAVRSEVTEYGPVEKAGSWTSQELPTGARCFTAVGLRANNRFVAIVHAAAHTIGVTTKAPSAMPIASEAL
jgi:hypothetical protein